MRVAAHVVKGAMALALCGGFAADANAVEKRPSILFIISTFPCLGTYFLKTGYEAAYSGRWRLAFKPQDVGSHGSEILASAKTQSNHDDGAAQLLARPHDKPFLLAAELLADSVKAIPFSAMSAKPEKSVQKRGQK